MAKRKLIVEVKEKKQKTAPWKIVVGIVAGLFLIYILTSGTPFIKSVMIKNSKAISPGEEIIVEEPYTVVEYYKVKEAVGPKICEDELYNTTFSIPNQSLYVSPQNKSFWNCSFYATNNEAVSGEFTMFVNWISRTGGFLSENQMKKILPEESAQFSFLYSMRDLSDTADCRIQKDLLPTLFKCRVAEPAPYAVVEKARTVTKYRNVTKIANDTNIQTTTYTNKTYSVNKFFGYEQPWYFGY